jgi:DNA-binding response OmpR family regulator
MGFMRVLVVEDFEVLAAAIGTGLRREGMAVDVVLDGEDALEHLAVTRYDVVVLDRDLPGTHGDEVCRRLVAGPSGSRILMLTAASTVKERVDGLGLGADDYLPKPFDFAELVARVRALARRSAAPLPPVLEAAGVSLDPGRRVALIRVGNTGTVIPPAELDRLFQPFQQRGRERIRHGDGHGLGLAIVRAIATAHKATITASARPEGGLDVEVSFP